MRRALALMLGVTLAVAIEMGVIETEVLHAQYTPTERDAIQEVMSGYYGAFGRDEAAAAAFFGEPTVIVLPNQVIALSKRADVEAFLAKFVASLKPTGFARSKLEGLPRIRLLNSTTTLYGTVAVRLKADGTEIQRAGFTYLLQKGSSGWKIHEIIATDLDKL
jgi:ketosteroid isomerase-like protein